jgi:hypothetical protein
MGSPHATTQAASSQRRTWHGLAAFGLLAAGGLAHLAYLVNDCPLDLSGDEAHYWEWSRRLDLSYYSKGPLVAYLIALSRWGLAEWSRQVVGSEALAVRLPAILLSIGTGMGIYVLALRTTRQSHLALSAVALTFTIPILAVGAILMTIDAPLACLYVWTLVAIQAGLSGRSTIPWALAGVLVALGILAKYTMVLIFPTIGLAMLIEPGFQAALRRPGPYLAAVIGLLGLVPILVWNSQHDWVSFRHVAGQAGVAGGPSLKPFGPISFLAGQAAVVGPVWLASMACAVVSLGRSPQPQAGECHQTADVRLLVCATITPCLAFLPFSLITKVQPNWPVVALLPGSILLVLWLARLLRRPRASTRRAAGAVIAAGAVLGGAAVIVLHHTEWLMPAFTWLARHEPPWNLTPTARYDPTSRLRGWSELGAAVGRVLESERNAGRDPFIATDDYQTASQIAFYCPGQPQVYCLQAALGDRQSQYDIWPNPIRDAERFVSRPCIYVGARKPELFGGVGLTHVALPGVDQPVVTVEHCVRGRLVQIWPIYVCPRYAGLPNELTRALPRF